MSAGLITLYHFTNRPNLELILKSKTINVGSYLSRKTLKHGLVSLTTDQDPEGHGLTDGREISKSQVRQLKYATELNGKYFCVDNTEFCIKFSISTSSVIPATTIHDQSELVTLEKTAYLPCSLHIGEQEINEVSNLLMQGRLIGKSKTWWYHRGNILLNQFELLHKRQPGNYCAVPKNATGEPDLSAIPVATIFEYS